MRVLFDQGTPVPLRSVLAHHLVETAYERGWQSLTNGELLQAAEAAGFELLVTTDQNLRHQQNLANRRIAILVLKTASWPKDSKAHGHGCHGCRRLGSGGVPGAVVPRVTAGPASRLPVSSFRSRSGEKPTAQTTCRGYQSIIIHMLVQNDLEHGLVTDSAILGFFLQLANERRIQKNRGW